MLPHAGAESRQRLLTAVLRELSLARDRGQIAAAMTAGTRRLLGADGASLAVREGDACVHAGEDAIAPLWPGRAPDLASELPGWVVRHAESAAIADVHAETARPVGALRGTFVRAALMVPVGSADPVGALGAFWNIPRAPAPDEIETLETLAAAAACAIETLALRRALHETEAAAAAQDRALEAVNRELHRRVAEFETLVDVMPVGIGIARDPLGNDIGTNRAFRDMLRLTPEANASLSAPEPERPRHFRLEKDGRALPPDSLPLQRAAREGVHVAGLELDLVFDDGVRRKLLEFAAPLFDENGRVRGSVGAFVDVTERAAAEERFRRLSDDAPMGIWITSADFRTIWVNRVWIEFTGLPLEAHLGSGWVDCVHPEDRPRIREASRAAFHARAPIEFEYRVRRHDGAYRWMLSRGHPFYEGAAFNGYVGLVVDVTAQHDAALAERQARKEAERANRLKDEFLASLSHELRTPLNAIVGWTYLLRERAGSPELVEQGLDTLERNAKLQTRLIDDLLDMSRILSGRVTLDEQPVSLQRVIEAAADSVRPDAVKKQIAIDLVLDPGVPAVLGDPTRLQQVVWNLLTNAVKFTDAGGRVAVTLSRTPADVRIAVRDDGAGIVPEFLPHLFERFRQADASAARRHGGLGIGLSIARHLVELHGGTIRAESSGPGRGSMFVVTLPARLPMPAGHLQAAGVAPAPDGPPGLAGVALLVVEDDEDSRRLVTLLLEERGALVRSVPSSQEALALLDGGWMPDALISDIGLPGVDGYDLMRRIRARGGPCGSLRAIALTAFARLDDRRRALEAGYQMHLPKPVEPDDLCAAVRMLLDRDAPPPSAHDDALPAGPSGA
jgi:PAS domain S-box-containing protein